MGNVVVEFMDSFKPASTTIPLQTAMRCKYSVVDTEMCADVKCVLLRFNSAGWFWHGGVAQVDQRARQLCEVLKV